MTRKYATEEARLEGRRATLRRYRDRWPEKVAAHIKKEHLKELTDPHRKAAVLLRSARVRAAEKSLPCDLDKEWIAERLLAGRCEVTGLQFKIIGGHNPFGPTLDQIIPKKGYTKDNCQVVIWAYNAAKGSGSHEDVMQMASALTYPQAH